MWPISIFDPVDPKSITTRAYLWSLCMPSLVTLAIFWLTKAKCICLPHYQHYDDSAVVLVHCSQVQHQWCQCTWQLACICKFSLDNLLYISDVEQPSNFKQLGWCSGFCLQIQVAWAPQLTAVTYRSFVLVHLVKQLVSGDYTTVQQQTI